MFSVMLGATQVTVASPSPATACTFDGGRRICGANPVGTSGAQALRARRMTAARATERRFIARAGRAVVAGIPSTLTSIAPRVNLRIRYPACGVTSFDGSDSGEGPFALLAVTVNVYVVPLVSPAAVNRRATPSTSQVSPSDE